jgi:hypothetical protein
LTLSVIFVVKHLFCKIVYYIIADISLTTDETLEVAYSVSSNTGELDTVLDVTKDGTEQDLTNLGVEDVYKFQWSPTSTHDGNTYTFDVNGETISVSVDNTPASGISRYNFNNENNDDSELLDVWGTNHGTMSGTSFVSGGDKDGSGSYSFDNSTGKVEFSDAISPKTIYVRFKSNRSFTGDDTRDFLI